jgi:acyl carrier protein
LTEGYAISHPAKKSGEDQMFQKRDVFEQLVRHIGEFIERDVSHLSRDGRIVNAIPGIDSLRLQEVLLHLEDCFLVRFDDAVLDHIETLQDLADHIQQLQAAQPEMGEAHAPAASPQGS